VNLLSIHFSDHSSFYCCHKKAIPTDAYEKTINNMVKMNLFLFSQSRPVKHFRAFRNLFIFFIFYFYSHFIRQATWQKLNAFRHVDMVKMIYGKFKLSIKMGKKGDLSDFECGMVAGARRASLNISETADLQGVYIEWSEKEKISSEQQFCGRKCPVGSRGQRRMVRLVRADRKVTVTQNKHLFPQVYRRANLNAQHFQP